MIPHVVLRLAYTGRQYRALITNSGTPSFLVCMQDVGLHEVS